jgi:hypothetical protein
MQQPPRGLSCVLHCTGVPNEENLRLQEACSGMPALLRGARTPEERQMLLNMAETWEGLAGARERKLAKEGKTEDD